MRDAWAASPTRFREDANAEEDLRLGGYARSWLVELAQNAADAARAAGVAGRLRVAVEDGELRVANTGAPLDAPGVAALASLRASAKRDGRSVGRFGVGFAAVLALSDAPRVVSGTGGVAFSAERTARAVRGLAGAAAELERRDGQLPVLRLVWPVGDDEPPIPDGYDTEVRLPLRPGTDPAALLTEAGADAAALLLALPDLAEITVGGAVLRREDGPAARVTTAWLVTDGRREAWLLARASGELDAGEIAALAVEQRGFAAWSVCWALPVDADGRPEPATRPDEMRNSRRWDAQLAGGPGVGAGDGVVAGITGDGVLAGGAAGEVLHAPTATAERLSLPARLIATVPLDPDRRHVRPGPATERVLAAAAAAYVHLVAALAPADRLALVPAAGFPRSEVDGRLRELVLAALTGADWLPGADGTDVAPSRAEWLDLPGEDLPGLLAESGAFPGLLAVPQRPPTALGIARLGPAAMADRLIGVEMAPPWWRAVYAALAPAVDAVPGLAEELGALPVPLLGERSPGMGQERRMRGPRHTPGDLRTVPGPAAVLLTVRSPAVEAVAGLQLTGLHLAHPDAGHPLLERLGARP
ncbi:MAG: sacsin N-terminal ATP-binding-like domain-containing protein, partial [Pseudonocardia sp.]